MSKTVKEMIDRWITVSGWTHGDRDFPAADTVPTINEVEDGLLDDELLALVQLPEWRQTEATFTTASGTAFYTDISDMMDRRVINMEITQTSGAERNLEFIDHTTISKDNPGWDDADSTGVPTHYTIKPEDGSIGLWPVPDGAYTITLIYEQQPKKFAVPIDRDHFISREIIPKYADPANDSVGYSAEDMIHTHCDRPRKVTCTQWLASGVGNADGSVEIVGPRSADGVELGEWTEDLDWYVDGAAETGDLAGLALKMETSIYYDNLTDVTIEPQETTEVDDVEMSVGLGDFDSTVYTSNSHLPDNFALLVGPYHMAYLWAKMNGDEEAEMKFRQDRDEAIGRLIEEYATIPDTKLFAMTTRGHRRRRTLSRR